MFPVVLIYTVIHPHDGSVPPVPNTALALASALHRYSKIDKPADVFDAVCADWPHPIAVLVNDYTAWHGAGGRR